MTTRRDLVPDSSPGLVANIYPLASAVGIAAYLVAALLGG